MAAEPAWSRRRRDDPVIGMLIAAGIPTTVLLWAAYWPTCTGEILFRPRRSYSADDLHRTASSSSIDGVIDGDGDGDGIERPAGRHDHRATPDVRGEPATP